VRKILLSCLAAGLLGVTVPAAHAAYPSYRGGCSYASFENGTGTGALGGRNVYTGVVYLLAVSTDDSFNKVPDGGPITVTCELWINGVKQRDVLGPVSGTGVVAGAAPLQFRARYDDVVNLCERVTTARGSGLICAEATTSQIPPQPIIDAINAVLDLPLPVGGSIRELLVDPALALYAELVRIGDAAVCAVLGGDVLVEGYWIYDCPPAA
jgi:hypothetical protein